MDENSIVKIHTFKSGNFVFSSKYDRTALGSKVYGLTLLYKTVISLPMLPDWSTRFNDEIIKKSIFGTAALEGNPLTEEEVGKIIGESEKRKSVQRAEQEIINLKTVYETIRQQEPVEQPVKLTEVSIREKHKLITKSIEFAANVPGTYRNHVVKVGDRDHGGVYTPPKCLPDIQNLMKEFCKWINSKEIMALDAVVRAALAHYYLGLIHPFGDGNGRTARAVEGFLLRVSGIKLVPTMLSSYYYRNMDDYFWSFSLARKNKDHDVTPFITFVLDGVMDSLKEIEEGVVSHLRILLMRDFAAFLRNAKKITQRQKDLIDTMLEHGSYAGIVLQDLIHNLPYKTLYRGTSERTARRDLKRLCDLNLLLAEQGKYKLNFATFQ
ncbi:MAG: Fic family protein [Deltaproteobacteria bacterium]|nr:Fic family protein [Deltaproteobacteria bacterium]